MCALVFWTIANARVDFPHIIWNFLYDVVLHITFVNAYGENNGIVECYITLFHLQQFLGEMEAVKDALQSTKLKELWKQGASVEKHVVDRGEIAPSLQNTENNRHHVTYKCPVIKKEYLHMGYPYYNQLAAV